MKLSRLISRFRKPIAIRRVRGRSMSPTLSEGDIVVFSSLKKPKHQQIVLTSVQDRDVVKRVHATSDSYSLRGDNRFESTDYENVPLEQMIASLIYPQR